MTKEITKARILQEIQDKFNLREFAPANFLFEETVLPIYDIGPHLTKWSCEHSTVSITSTGGKIFFTIPDNEQWLLRAYQLTYLVTGAIKGTGLFVDTRPSSADFLYFDLKKGQEVSYLVNLPTPVVLQPGNRLMYMIDTYVSTQDLRVDIDVRKEEIR